MKDFREKICDLFASKIDGYKFLTVEEKSELLQMSSDEEILEAIEFKIDKLGEK